MLSPKSSLHLTGVLLNTCFLIGPSKISRRRTADAANSKEFDSTKNAAESPFEFTKFVYSKTEETKKQRMQTQDIETATLSSCRDSTSRHRRTNASRQSFAPAASEANRFRTCALRFISNPCQHHATKHISRIAKPSMPQTLQTNAKPHHNPEEESTTIRKMQTCSLYY